MAINGSWAKKIYWLIPGMTSSLKKRIAQVMVILDEGG
jgi:hypothetical protein